MLAHIIDYTSDTGFGSDGYNEDYYSGNTNRHATSTGHGFLIYGGDITGAGMDDHGGINDLIMSKISEVLNTGLLTPILPPNPEDPDDLGDPAFNPNDLTTEYQKLSSIYNQDGSTKTLKQWAKDLYYICKNYTSLGVDSRDVADTIIVFQKHLVGSLGAFDFDGYRNDYAQWRSEEPNPKDVDIIAFPDSYAPKWYANLWNAMNGTEVGEITDVKYNYISTTGQQDLGFGMLEVPKEDRDVYTSKYNTPETDEYIVIPDELLNDPQWLTNIVNDAYAIIQVFVPRESIIKDTSVAVETVLREVPDETAIKKAEAKYEADMRRIDLKDRKYDTDLAAIDNERNAIKQEIETLKTVAKDNVERTFKLFG